MGQSIWAERLQSQFCCVMTVKLSALLNVSAEEKAFTIFARVCVAH